MLSRHQAGLLPCYRESWDIYAHIVVSDYEKSNIDGIYFDPVPLKILIALAGLSSTKLLLSMLEVPFSMRVKNTACVGVLAPIC